MTENEKYIDNMIAEVKDGTMDIDEVMTDMFGEGGKEEVRELYREEAKTSAMEVGLTEEEAELAVEESEMDLMGDEYGGT